MPAYTFAARPQPCLRKSHRCSLPTVLTAVAGALPVLRPAPQPGLPPAPGTGRGSAQLQYLRLHNAYTSCCCRHPLCAAPGPSARFAPSTRNRQGISGAPNMLMASPSTCTPPAGHGQDTIWHSMYLWWYAHTRCCCTCTTVTCVAAAAHQHRQSSTELTFLVRKCSIVFSSRPADTAQNRLHVTSHSTLDPCCSQHLSCGMSRTRWCEELLFQLWNGCHWDGQ
jgi:hypothetical protein